MLLSSNESLTFAVESESEVTKNSSRRATKDIVPVVSDHADESAATRKFRMRWLPCEYAI